MKIQLSIGDGSCLFPRLCRPRLRLSPPRKANKRTPRRRCPRATPSVGEAPRETANPPEIRSASRVQASYKQLAQAAVSLNFASDELGKAVAVLDAALKKLNLGVAAWVTLSGSDGLKLGQGWWWSRDLGYAKISDKWGMALRTTSGNEFSPGDDSEEVWSFNDAPRWMRTEAVAKIPDLLEALLRQAQDTTKGIQKGTVDVLEFAAAIDAIADDSQRTEGW